MESDPPFGVTKWVDDREQSVVLSDVFIKRWQCPCVPQLQHHQVSEDLGDGPNAEPSVLGWGSFLRICMKTVASQHNARWATRISIGMSANYHRCHHHCSHLHLHHHQ